MFNDQKTIQTRFTALLLLFWMLGGACDQANSSIRCCECMIEADAFRCALDQDRDECLGECESVEFRCHDIEKAGCDEECACVD